MATNGDEFYIGYMPGAPPRTARFVRAVVWVLSIAGVAFGVAMVALHRRPGDAVWRPEQETFTGVISIDPYPVLRAAELDGRAATALIVNPGKFGARDALAPYDGRVVALVGTRLTRDGRVMIELADRKDAITPQPDARPPHSPAPIDLGEVTLRGEIIDPKCYQGAMKPGSGKTHRACAVRCISGGIPPMLAVPGNGPGSDPARPRHTTCYLLTDHQGRAVNQPILPYVGDFVEVRARLFADGDLLILRIADGGISRL